MSRLMRRILAVRQDCAYCGEMVSYETYGPLYATIDHITPRSHGGRNDAANKTLSCLHCNRQKGRHLDWPAPAFTLAEIFPMAKARENEDERDAWMMEDELWLSE